jgi:hypothetical protein
MGTIAKIFPVASVNRKAVGFSPGVALGYVRGRESSRL